jgi:hypothetical protein
MTYHIPDDYTVEDPVARKADPWGSVIPIAITTVFILFTLTLIGSQFVPSVTSLAGTPPLLLIAVFVAICCVSIAWCVFDMKQQKIAHQRLETELDAKGFKTR